MKKELIIGMCFWGLAFFTACSNDDEDLTPSYADQNWYKLEDSDEPADHAFYELFRIYGVPVFITTPLGKKNGDFLRKERK